MCVCFRSGFTFHGSPAHGPIRGEQQQQIVAVTMPLADFEHRLLAGHDVAAMPVDEHQPLEAVLNEVFQQAAQQIEIHAGRSRKRAGEIEVMVRVAQPQERREHDAVGQGLGRAADDLAQQHAVGEQRHVAAVLFQGRHRKDDGRVFGKRCHGRPRHLLQLHGRETPGGVLPGNRPGGGEKQTCRNYGPCAPARKEPIL